MTARKQYAAEGIKVSYEDLIIFALCKVLGQLPHFNGEQDEEKAVLSDAVHMSIAISTPQGLMAPTLRDAQSYALPELVERRRDLIERAMEAKLKVSEMSGGTFTVSNLGISCIDHFTPIINHPQLALLGLGRIRKQAVVTDEGELVVGHTMGLSLTADHRFIDGAPAAEFLDKLSALLETVDEL
jgi:pyruvate dehydrogenase E2 component (dihydrolipoamide acetyltransferase)